MTTPLLKEYFAALREEQEKYTNVVLFFQVGSFYENYGYNDVNNTEYIATKILNIEVRPKDLEKDVSINNPLFCGFQCEYLGKFLDKLIDNLYTVVTYDQVKNDKPNEKSNEKKYKLEERVRSNVYTPSTYAESEYITRKSVNGLMMIYLTSYLNGLTFSMAYIEILTGKIQVYECHKTDKTYIYDEIFRLIESKKPKELIINVETSKRGIEIDDEESLKRMFGLSKYNYMIHYNKINLEIKNLSYQREFLKKIYNLEDSQLSPIILLDLDKYPSIVLVLILLLQYINDHNTLLLNFLDKPEIINPNNILTLTNDTIYQLNIISRNEGETSLYDIINKSSTEMGARMLKNRMLFPTTDINKLENQYDLINKLMSIDRTKYKAKLSLIRDLEKLSRRMSLQMIKPYSVYLFYTSCKEVLNILDLAKLDKEIEKYFYNINLSNKIISLIDDFDKNFSFKNAINGISIDLFVKGIDPDIDKYRNNHENTIQRIQNIVNNWKEILKNKSITNSSINIETKGNKYFITMTKSKWDILKKSENFSTNGLNITEGKQRIKIKIKDLNIINKETNNDTNKETNKETNDINDDFECNLKRKFNDIILSIYKKNKDFLIKLIDYVAKLDYFITLADVSSKNNYIRPIISKESKESFIEAKSLRHPIIEKINTKTNFIANDISLGKERKGMLLHGMNSCGKSILLKSVGLSIILAQMGCYVPAKSFTYYPYNRIISRVTYDDNMYKDMSSFIVEMTEIRTVLRYSDNRSLILGDEVCKGTEYASCVSIVGASILELCKNGVSFIFSTHYHYISLMEEIIKLQNSGVLYICHLYAEMTKDEIIYERKLKEGTGPSDYGIETCKYLSFSDDFIQNCIKIRNKILDKPDEIIPSKRSNYSQDLFMIKCEECGKMNSRTKPPILETHHLEEQHTAINGIIDNGEIQFHKDVLSNLVVICKDCHQNIHKNNKKLEKKQTSKGVKIISK